MEGNVDKIFFCNIVVSVTNTDINETLNISSDSIDSLETMIVEKIFNFSNKHSFHMPLNYIDDSMSPCNQNEDCQEIYIIFLKSNYFSEDDFYIFWDNQMKRFGRMR